MRYFILILLIFSETSVADIVNFGAVKKDKGVVAACKMVEEEYLATSSLYHRAHYQGYINTCFYRSNEFKSLSKLDKRKSAKLRSASTAEAVSKALRSDEEVSYDLISRINVSEDYPDLNEKLTKIKIKMETEREVVVPPEDEGDVHSIGNYIWNRYRDMATAYTYNDMHEDAVRIANEYGQIHWVGERGTLKMKKHLEKYKERLKKKRENKKKGIVEKADPKKVTAPLVAYQEILQPRESLKLAAVNPSVTSVVKKEIEVNSILEKYGIYILAVVLVIGIYLVSLARKRRENKL